MRPSLEVAKERFKNTTAFRNAAIGVEIGVLAGGNALDMLEHFPNLYLLHLIDSYTGHYPFYYSSAKRDLKKHEDRIAWHILSSQDAVKIFTDNTIDFVYIDNGHTYEQVKGDANRWWPKVRVGGMLCGHDYVLPGDVKTAIDEFVKENNLTLYTDIGLDNACSDWWIFKG